MNIIPVTRPTVVELTQQWDEVASTRLRQITSGLDVSYKQTLIPAILEEMGSEGYVLDLGCGVGALANQIADLGADVLAIDPSSVSVSLAVKNFSRPNIEFKVSSIEDLPSIYHDKFDVIVCNMVLMDVIDLELVLTAARDACRRNAKFVATLTHPCFWPHYFGYARARWFDYDREIFISTPFRIANEVTDISTVHVHRPLASYFSVLTSHGFNNIQLTELYGDGPFAYPRFIRLVAVAV